MAWACFSGQQIERLVIAALREVTLDEAMDRAGNLTEQPGDVAVPRRWKRMKLHGAVGTGGKDAVGEHGVGVAVEVEQRTEALHEGDGTGVRVGNAVGACSSPLPGEQLGQEHTECLAQQFAVSGEQKPYPTRQRQYPLSIGHDGEYVVDEIDRGVCHSTTCARRAESAGFAQERDPG